MQTYWDAATNRWVTRLPDGTVRAATNAEALLAYSNGAQAPVGSTGPKPEPPPPAPAHVLYFDAATGKYTIDDGAGGFKEITGQQATAYAAQGWQISSPTTVTPLNPDGSAIGGGNPVPPAGGGSKSPSSEDPAPQPNPYPALDMTWRNNDQYSVYGRLHGQGSYFQGANGAPLDTSQQLFYQTGEGRPVAYAKFAGEEADPNSYYYRWLQGQQSRVDNGFKDASVADPNLQYTYYLDQQSKGLNSTFANLPGWQQGYNPSGGFAGRRM